MRTMPKVIHDDQGNAIEVPSMPREQWLAELAKIAGRELTAEELARADKMGDHNWTLRVVATELFGDAVVDAYFAPKDTDTISPTE